MKIRFTIMKTHVNIIFLLFILNLNAQSRYELSTKTSYNIQDKKGAKKLLKSMKRKELDLTSLTTNEISDLYWYIKQDCYYLRKVESTGYNKDDVFFTQNARTLIDFARAALELEKTGNLLKLEILEFLQQQEHKPFVLTQNPNYLVLKYNLDTKFNYFLLNKDKMSNEEIKELVSSFEKETYFEQDYMDMITNSGAKRKRNDQISKLSSVQLELAKRDTSLAGFMKLMEMMEMIPVNHFHYFIELNYSELKLLSEKVLVNNTLALQYADLLYNMNEYQKALTFLNLIKVSPIVKIRIFRCKLKLNGIINATDYLFAQKPKARNWNNIMAEATNDLNSNERYELVKHLHKNYKKSLDSLDFTVIFGFQYTNICQFVICDDPNQEPEFVITSDKLLDQKVSDPKILEENFQFVNNLLKEYNYTEESEYYKTAYWKQRIYIESSELGCGPWCYEVINKYVKQGSITKVFGSRLVYNQASLLLESLNGRGVRGTPEFEKPYREIINLCLKSVQMDPNNALNYKLLGDVYSFLGDGNKNQYYYRLAESKGVYMSDRQRPGKGKSGVKTGPRGGKFYINSNGNKTYVD